MGAAALAALHALVLSPRAAQGEPVARSTDPGAVAQLAYDARASASECPDEAAFRALVIARLGRDPFDASASTRVAVAVAHAGDAIVGTVAFTGAGGEDATREVRGAHGECEAVVEALASVVAVQLSSTPSPPSLPSAPPLPEPRAPAKSPSEAPPPPRDEPPAAHLQAPTTTTTRFAARAAFVTSFGALPATTAGGELGVGFERRWLSVFVMGRGETQLGDAEGARGERIEGAWLGAGLLPCVSSSWLVGCATAWVGQLQGRAPEAASPSLGSALVGYVGARGALSLPMGARLRLTPQVEAWVPLVRTTLVYAGAPTWTAPALSGSLGLGLVYVAAP